VSNYFGWDKLVACFRINVGFTAIATAATMAVSKCSPRHYLQPKLDMSLVQSPIMEIHFIYFYLMNFIQFE
jgi:hypothetical protein